MKKVVLATVALVGFAFADAPASYATCKACHGVKGETISLLKVNLMFQLI